MITNLKNSFKRIVGDLKKGNKQQSENLREEIIASNKSYDMKF